MNMIKYCSNCGSKLTEIKIDGRVRKFCRSCNIPKYENPVPATAAVCFDANGRILLVKRAVEPMKNLWCLPGGFLEIDETPGNGCLRELKEETGLTGEIVGLGINKRSESPFYSSVLVIGYEVIITGGKLKAGDDSSEAAFFRLDELPKIAFQSHMNILNYIIKQGRFDIKKDILNEIGAYVITSCDHISITREACKAGARVIQYRDKESFLKDKLKIAKEIRNITHESGTLFIVNDNVDIALLSGADGIHLGQDDLYINDVKKIVPENFIIGRSTHSLDQALKAESDGADYIGIGPVFKTPTKKDYIPVGAELAKLVVKRVNVPVVAIGGINMENLGQLSNSGLKNFAMVREFSSDTFKTVRKVNKMLLDI